MKTISMLTITALALCTGAAERPVDVRVRQTPQGPRIFVDGKAVRPRFYYGSQPCPVGPHIP